MTTRRTFPLSVNEELFVCLDADGEPQTMHLEVRFEGALDVSKVRSAASMAARLHPMARAQLRRRRLLVMSPVWGFSEGEVSGAVDEVRANDDSDVQRIRCQFLSTGFDLRKAPLWRVLVVHRAGGDSLMLSMHHSIADGVGLARYLGSILRAYGGQDDPTPSGVDPLEIRYLAKNLADRFPDQPAASVETAPKGKRAFVAPAATAGGHGYGLVHLRLPRDWQHPEHKHRDLRGSRGEYSMHAALHRAIDVWNGEQGKDTPVLATMMPINIRDSRWKREVVANVVLSIELFTTPDQRRTDDALLETITRQVRAWKERESFGVSLHPSVFLRRVVAPFLFSLPRGPQRRFARDAAVLTCAGPADESIPDAQIAGKIVEVWGSPPTAMPIGVSMCVMSLENDVFVTMRYHRTLFDDAAAQQFAGIYLNALESLSLTGPATSAATSSRVTSATSLTPTSH